MGGLQDAIGTPHKNQMEQTEIFMETANIPGPDQFLNDQLIEDSIDLSGNCDNDLLFHQLPLPEQLLQSDEKDGEDDSSNSSMHGVNRNNFDLTGLAANDQEQQDQIKVRPFTIHNTSDFTHFVYYN